MTELIMLAKRKNSTTYCAIFIAGNGGAWNDIVSLWGKKNNDVEAIEWAEKIKISKKWKVKRGGFAIIPFLAKPTFDPYCAGADEIKGVENQYIIDNGFQTSHFCDEECMVSWNGGSRNNPDMKERRFMLNPKYEFFLSRGAGRSSKERLFLEEIDKDYILIKCNPWRKL